MTKARDLATSGPASGLVLIKPGSVVNGTDNGNGVISFSGASSMSLNDVFSATYTTYRIIIRVKGNTDLGCFYRLRASGTDNSAANYDRQYIGSNSTVVGAGRFDNQTSGNFGNMGSVFWSLFLIDITNPFTTEYTSAVSHNLYSTANIQQAIVVNIHDVATSFDGITIFPDSGYNMTGTISVFGYKD